MAQRAGAGRRQDTDLLCVALGKSLASLSFFPPGKMGLIRIEPPLGGFEDHIMCKVLSTTPSTQASKLIAPIIITGIVCGGEGNRRSAG